MIFDLSYRILNCLPVVLIGRTGAGVAYSVIQARSLGIILNNFLFSVRILQCRPNDIPERQISVVAVACTLSSG